MAFWKDALEAIGGFDPQFRVAGDDVDICWRLQERGWTLGFCAAAMVWHQRRGTVGSYLKQQRGYGRAEALLERKWPERYNRGGHLAWAGRVYPAARYSVTRRRNRIRYGSWGSNLFQSVYHRGPSTPGLLPLMPEWYLVIAVLAVVAVYEVVHDPLLFPVPLLGAPVSLVLLAVSIAALAVQAARAGAASVRAHSISHRGGFGLTLLTAVMYVLQPLARLVGRLQLGLTPWRRRGTLRAGVVWPRTILSWSTTWRSVQVRLADIESTLRPNCMSVVRGGECDRWDIHVRLGPLAAARLRLTAEEHGQGRQLRPRARVAASFTRRDRARRVPDCDVCAGGSPRRRPLGAPSRLCGHSPGAASDHGMRGRDGRHRRTSLRPTSSLDWTGCRSATRPRRSPGKVRER